MSDTTADEIRAAQQARREKRQATGSTQRSEADNDKTSLMGTSLDSDIYESGTGSRFANHDLSIDVGGGGGMDEDVDDEGNSAAPVRLLDSCESALPAFP